MIRYACFERDIKWDAKKNNGHEVTYSTQLYWDKSIGFFTDEDGFIVFNIYDYITPDMFYMFRKKREYMCFEPKHGWFVELMYPEDDEEEFHDVGYVKRLH